MNICPVYKGNEDCRTVLNGRANLCVSCRVKKQKDFERARPKRVKKRVENIVERQDYAHLIAV